MVEKVIIEKYRSFDEKLFDDIESCKNHEHLIIDIRSVEMALEPIPKDVNFLNGHGYVQHNPLNFNIAMSSLFELLKSHINDTPENKGVRSAVEDACRVSEHTPEKMSNLSRLLEYNGVNSYLIALMRDRFNNIDSRLREWGQLYFALNPDAGDQHCLNKKEIC